MKKVILILCTMLFFTSCSSMYEKGPYTLEYSHPYNGHYHHIDEHKIEDLSFFERLGLHIIDSSQ